MLPQKSFYMRRKKREKCLGARKQDSTFTTYLCVKHGLKFKNPRSALINDEVTFIELYDAHKRKIPYDLHRFGKLPAWYIKLMKERATALWDWRNIREAERVNRNHRKGGDSK